MRKLGDLVLIVALTGVYVAVSFASHLVETGYHGATPMWLGAGLGLALLWLYGGRFVVVIFFGELIFGLLMPRPLLAVIGSSFIGVLEAAVAVRLLTHFTVSTEFRDLRSVGLFIAFGAIVPSILAGLAGAGQLVANGMIPLSGYGPAAGYWALGDVLGVLVITPLICTWRHGWPFEHTKVTAKWGAIMIATLLLGIVIMRLADTPDRLFFLLLPFVVLAAAVSCVAGASSVTVVLALCVLGLSLRPVGDGFTVAARLLFVGTAAVTGYLLAAALAERRSAEARLAHNASHDSLTRLSNRTAFDAVLWHLTETDGTHALVYLDLEHFKLLNDSRGHQFGDRFLAGLAADMQAETPPDALLARFGGDEFAVLLRHADTTAANHLASALRHSVLNYNHIEDGLVYNVGVSIGMTLFDGGEEPEAVLSRADIACYSAKREGPNCVHQYHRDDPDMQADHLEIQRASQLHTAFDEGRFRLARQLIAPLAETGDESASRYEILFRLRGQDGANLPPGSFLSVAARYGLMPVVDRWVIKESFRYLASTSEPLHLSINLFGLTLSDPRLFEYILATKERFGIDPQNICFEVTEQSAIQNLTRTVPMMNRLVDEGFKFSLDDFGTGVASFGYLQDLPVAFVKIDGRFIRDIESDPANPVIVESLVKLAAVKNIQCVGEWIETREILERVRELGVGFGQGFYLHKPELLSLYTTMDGVPA